VALTTKCIASGESNQHEVDSKYELEIDGGLAEHMPTAECLEKELADCPGECGDGYHGTSTQIGEW